jgi:Semialdehyde dehydrogenase, dimerisation domain
LRLREIGWIPCEGIFLEVPLCVCEAHVLLNVDGTMKLTHEFFTRLVLETIYLQPTDPDVTEDELFEAYEDAYTNAPFIRIRKNLPNLKHVVGTNY